MAPGAAGAWDDQFTCNPTPHVLANGSVLLLYKGRSKENFNHMSTGVAFAQHWKGQVPSPSLPLKCDLESIGIEQMFSLSLQENA